MLNEFLRQLALTLGGTAIAVAAMAWLARSVITQWLSKDIEAHKAKLKAEADVSLERLRSELQITAARRNIEYARIHEKRLEIISELAGKLDAFHQRVDAYVSIVEWADTPSKEERRKLAADAFGDFNKYFRPRRFFLPEHTVKKIEDFRAALYKISIEFMLYVEQGREYRSDATKDIDVWSEASKYTTEEAPKLIKELEDDFRKILLDEPEMA
jgi:hypothetical protein